MTQALGFQIDGPYDVSNDEPTSFVAVTSLQLRD